MRGVLVPITSLAQETMLRHIDHGGIGPHNGVRFSGGPNRLAKAKQDATTATRRKMEAKPRLVAGKTSQHTKAVRCKRELDPAAMT